MVRYGCARILSACLLASCAQVPLAPTAAVTAGPGKTDAAFRADVDACKASASQAVSGQVNASNQKAVAGAVAGAALGLVSGGAVTDVASTAATNGTQTSQDAQGTIQGQYDAAFNSCMYARGDNVPGMAAQVVAPAVVQTAAYHPVYRDPTVVRVQTALVHLGYLHGVVDGVAGPKTEAAIRQFETDKSLPVDGVSSPALVASLQRAEADAGNQAKVQPVSDTSGSKWAMPPPAAQNTTTK